VSRPHALLPVEVERIRAALPSSRDRLLVSLMAYAGLRCEEALALGWYAVGDDVLTVERAFTAGQMKPTKTSQWRPVDLVAPLAQELAEARPANPGRDALVVPGATALPLDLRNWRWRKWKKAAEAAGVEGTPYDCRHTFATLLANAGKPPAYAAYQMGHSTTTMTDRYTGQFKESDVGHGTPVADAILAARAEVFGEQCHQSAIDGVVNLAEVRARKAETPANTGVSG
jgi:integrase